MESNLFVDVKYLSMGKVLKITQTYLIARSLREERSKHSLQKLNFLFRASNYHSLQEMNLCIMNIFNIIMHYVR